jgi:hypothetical protein
LQETETEVMVGAGVGAGVGPPPPQLHNNSASSIKASFIAIGRPMFVSSMLDITQMILILQ